MGFDDDDDDDDVNVMHHLGQRCMSAIVSALQIQTSAAQAYNHEAYVVWCLTPIENDSLDQRRQNTARFWCRTRNFLLRNNIACLKSDQAKSCTIPAGIVGPRAQCKE